MNRILALAFSILCMGIALMVSLTNDPVVSTARASETPEVQVTTAASVEAPTSVVTEPVSPSEVVTAPGVEISPQQPSTPVQTPVETTPTPQEDETGWDCTVSGNRVCGVPDQAGVVHLVCHNVYGHPVMIVSNAHNCK